MTEECFDKQSLFVNLKLLRYSDVGLDCLCFEWLHDVVVAADVEQPK